MLVLALTAAKRFAEQSAAAQRLLDGVVHANLDQARLFGGPLLGHIYPSLDVHHAIWLWVSPTEIRRELQWRNSHGTHSFAKFVVKVKSCLS
jgi:hypothetical protein